eukprot:scaffold236692_cov41-Tisochrysis_lutea.AAC.3
MRQKPPIGKRGRKEARRKTKDPKSVKATTRLAEFPDQTFLISQGKLYCKACKTDVTLIKSSIHKHISTSKHKDNLAKFNIRNAWDEDIKVFLSDYFKEHPDEIGGTNIAPETLLHRYRVVAGCLKNGVPLEKVDGLRPLLEVGGRALCHSSGLRAFIPKIEEQEILRLRGELENQYVSIIALSLTGQLG